MSEGCAGWGHVTGVREIPTRAARGLFSIEDSWLPKVFWVGCVSIIVATSDAT